LPGTGGGGGAGGTGIGARGGIDRMKMLMTRMIRTM
jgi:hypothetical protein